MTSEMVLNAKSVDISREDEVEGDERTEEEGPETNEESEEEWQEDREIDWDKGIDISEDTDWDDSDVQMAESDEAQVGFFFQSCNYSNYSYSTL